MRRRPLDADSLRAEKIDLTDEEKEEILRCWPRIGRQERTREGHLAVLDLVGQPSTDVLRSTFAEMINKYHPDRYARRRVGSFRFVFSQISERVVEAHDALLS